jgi:hypothetical protein
MKDEYAAEADTVEDVLDADNPVIDRIIEQEQNARKQEIVSQMRTAMNRTDALVNNQPMPQPAQPVTQPMQPTQPVYQQPVQPAPQPVYQQPAMQPRPIQAPGANYNPMPMPQPTQPVMQPAAQPMTQPVQPTPQPVYQQPTQPVYQQLVTQPQPSVQQLTQASLNQAAVNQQMQNLANNDTFSIQTIAQQANRITNNAMMVDHEAGLHAPTFTPMSQPLPHEIAPGQLYRPIEENNPSQSSSNPDLYGPPTAIFSS